MSSELPSHPTPPIERSLGHLFRIGHQNFRAQLTEVIEAKGITPVHYAALSAFDDVGDLSSADLARVLEASPQASNVIVHRLLELGLLVRRPHAQGRARLLRLSRKGRRTIDQVSPDIRDVQRRALRGLTGQEQRIVRRWLVGMAEWSRGEESPPLPPPGTGRSLV